ncbi:hypothetical protein OSTOST_02551, partial [Ostertagia ostertagi]
RFVHSSFATTICPRKCAGCVSSAPIACPDVPSGSMASFVPPNCSEQCQVEKKVLQDTVAKQNGELSHLRMEVDRMQSVVLRKDIRISELIKELEASKTRVKGLEELCRNHMGGVRLPSHPSAENLLTEVEETGNEDDALPNISANDNASDELVKPEKLQRTPTSAC